jgi:hypothetical protein
MRIFLTILLFFFSLATKAQYTLAGYITSTDQGGASEACAGSGATLAIYTTGGTISEGVNVYTSTSGGTITDFGWKGYSVTSGGAITARFQTWGDGTAKNYALCGGGGGGGTSSGLAPAPTAWGKKIKPVVSIDMARYDFFGGGGNGIARFFDDSTNTSGLPIRNPNDYYHTGSEGYFSAHGIHFNGNRGLRFILDLIGDSNINDLSKKYIFRDSIYGFDNAYLGGGAIYMATLDSVLANVPHPNRWVYFARPDSMLKPFAKLIPNNGSSTGGLWRSYKRLRADSARYVIVWLVKDTTGGTANNYPDITEISFYGTPNFDSATVKRWADYTPVRPVHDFGNHIGVNVGTAYWSKYLKERIGIRYYAWPPKQFDKHLGDTSDLIFDANGLDDGDIYTKTFDTLNQLGTRPYLSMQGGTQRFLNQSGASDFNKVPWLNNYKDELENPASYIRAGRFYWNFGAKFGKNTAGLTVGQLNWNSDQPTGLGLNFFNEIEVENESALRSGLTELGLFWMSQLAYDGYERRFAKTGMKVSDSTMRLNMGATHYLDSNRVKAFVYYSHFFRTDSAFIWGTINQHHYSSTAFQDRTNPAMLSAEEQVGQTGTPVEREKMREKIIKYQKSDWKYLRGYRPWHQSEHGYDNNQQPVPNAGVAGFWSLYGAPNYAGFDSLQDKAIALQGAYMESFAAGVDNYVEFMFENPCLCPNNNPGLFASSGEVQAAGFDVEPAKMFAVFHVKNRLRQMMKGYKFDSAIRDTGNVHVFKLRSINNPDSVCYYVRYWPLDDAGQNITINVGSVNGNGTKKYLNFTDTPPTESAAVVNNGEVSAVAQARAQYYFFEEATIQAPIYNIKYRKRLRIQ